MKEASLIRKAIDGDEQALNLLVNNHKELAYNVAFRITQNSEDAKDVTQESFIKALQNLKRFRKESKFSTWLFRIVYNESLMLMRKRKNNLEFLDETFKEEIDEEDGESDYSEMKSELNEAIKSLNPKERNIIDLFYLGEKSSKEIKKITGMSSANIKVILHRARVKLKKHVKNG